ncbi:MAG TPA: histidine kinase [Caulobacteraceae bacterium]|nr:histidine kinase [Caulobacteraceae bacterium]
MTLRQDPPPTPRRDSPIALYSIVGFWSFYFLINSVRSLVMEDPHQVVNLGNRVVVASLSMVITGIFYLFIRGSSAASMRRSMVTAAVLALPAAIAYSTLNWLVFERASPPSHVWVGSAAHVSPPPPAPSGTLGIPAPPAPPPPPETLNVGHSPWEHELTPVQAIAENAASGYFFFVAWASLFLSLRYAGEVRVLERRAADLRAAAQNAELRALRYQVNPHFLFNTLNSLSSLILTGKGEQAERMILNLATFFRTSLTGDPTEDVSLAEEIALQRLYLDIEAVRFPDRLRVNVDLPEALATAQVPGLILQPLVENAVKHGVSRTVRPVTLAISARERGERLVLTVANSAPMGPCEQLPVDGAGVGLRNVRDRLAARFGDDGRCRWWAPAPGSFEVELTMPIVRNGR